MSDYQGYPFQYSEPLQPVAATPERFQSTIPVRVSRFSDTIRKEAEKARETLPSKIGFNIQGFASHGTIAMRGHLVSWAFPECPPSWIALFTEVAEIVAVFDDMTDTLDKESHERILEETLLRLTLGTLGTVGSQFVNDAAEGISGHFDMPDQNAFLMEMKDAFRAQTAHIGCDMSFNEYKAFKINHSGSRLMVNAVAHFKGQRVSKHEIESVAYFIDKCLLSFSLLNDLYSFAKEFDDHSTTGTVNTIANAMVLLMSIYGYSEDEAARILEQEIQALETQALKEFNSWQDSDSAKSSNLVGYCFTIVNMIGGMNYWMSHSERYHGTNLKTTAEDRARLIGQPPGVRILENYPPPLAREESTPIVPWSMAETKDSESKGAGIFTRMASEQAPLNGSECTDFATSITRTFRKAECDKLCMAPYDYISSLPGKGTIAKLVDATRSWLDVSTESSETIKSFTIMIFNSSLMLDDIQDESVKRRGMPAAHIMHGIGQTVNCVTYMGFKVFKLCEDLKDPIAGRKVLYDEMEALIFGQALELYWKFHKQCPSLSEYLVMIDNKTGGFFRLVIRLMITEASSSVPCADKLAHFATLLGRFYQIRDDYQNLVSAEYTATKGFCDDLSEGKFSIMLIHTLQTSPTADRIRGLIFGGARVGMPEEIRSYILSEMKAAGSLEYTHSIISEVYKSLVESLDELEALLGKNDLLRGLVMFLRV